MEVAVVVVVAGDDVVTVAPVVGVSRSVGYFAKRRRVHCRPEWILVNQAGATPRETASFCNVWEKNFCDNVYNDDFERFRVS